MQDVYKNIKCYKLSRKFNISIVLDNMIADIITNKKLKPTVPELFIRGRILNISLAFLAQFYLKVPKGVRLSHRPFLILRKFQINESFNKSQSIIHQILTL